MLDRLGKIKGNMPESNRGSIPEPPVRRPASAELESMSELPVRRPANTELTENADSSQQLTNISVDITIVGKITGKGAVKVFGRIEGELRASNVTISEGAQVNGEIFAEDLTIGGQVKGNIHANRVRLNSTSVVEGDIFHRSLAIEENARFEGSSRREANGVDLSKNPSQAASAAERRSNGGLDHDGDAYPAIGRSGAQRMGGVSPIGNPPPVEAKGQ